MCSTRESLPVNQLLKMQILKDGGIMKGDTISKEFQKMVWVRDKDGKEYACYIDDLKSIKKKEDLTEEEKAKCTDLSLVLGDSW